jgi:hypothetical protein
MLNFSKRSIEVNNQQYNAITRHIDVHQRIIASAGSGKTTTLTARIAYLIEHNNIPSDRIVLLTFSRNSANQMKKKLHDLIGYNQVWAGTFHGLAKHLLQTYSPKSIQTLYFIDELVSMGEKWLTTENGRKWVGRLRYIFVDEFQDINNIQMRMIQRMLRPGAKLIVVGDDCQNIYTWRGSNVQLILELEKQLKGLVDDQLNINYRSSDSIIQVANAVMKHIPTLPWKHTMVSHLPKYKKPNVHFFYRIIDETNYIIRTIQQIQSEEPNASIAIMSRMNVDLYRFEEECILKNISYRIFEMEGVDGAESVKHNCVDLVTVHASKGLEWDYVFVVHMNDDVFPSSKKKEDIVNERRLFYVAVTRARKVLTFSYTNDERNLSRFIREVPSTLLTYHGLAKYMLSSFELGKTHKKLRDVLGCLNTEDIQSLRESGLLDWFHTDKLIVSSLYPADMYWKKPDWINNETLPDFQRFLNVWLKRHFAHLAHIKYKDNSSEKLIFTLRIFNEDFEFWSANKENIQTLVETYFGNIEKDQDFPNVDYKMLESWALENSVEWKPNDIVQATTILGKIRGQLRPLRFHKFSIKEFSIGPSRFLVPIQWRGEVLESWRALVNPNLHWKDCLVDIWRIGALSLVAEGRNVAMYRAPRIKQYLEDVEFQNFLSCIERYTSEWFQTKNLFDISIVLKQEDGLEIYFDFRTKHGLYSIGGVRFDSAELLSLAIGSTFCEEISETVGILIPLDGKIFTLKLPEHMKEISEHIISLALSKS